MPLVRYFTIFVPSFAIPVQLRKGFVSMYGQSVCMRVYCTILPQLLTQFEFNFYHIFLKTSLAGIYQTLCYYRLTVAIIQFSFEFGNPIFSSNTMVYLNHSTPRPAFEFYPPTAGKKVFKFFFKLDFIQKSSSSLKSFKKPS